MRPSIKSFFCLLTAALITFGAQNQTSQTRRLNVLIVDEKNHSLDDVQEREIEVWENGVRQNAKLERQRTPVRYGLVVDTSGSLRSQFQQVVETARAFVRANNETDETALIRFVDSSVIQALQTFTSDKQSLQTKIDTLFVQRGQTALVDAIHASLTYVSHEARKAPDKRNALVLITDGEDRQSNHSLEELLNFIGTKDIKIFTIGLTSELDKENGFIRKAPKQKAEDLLEALAKHSGGRTFFVKKKDDFPRAVLEIVSDLRNYYLVSYTSSTSASTKPKIEIKVSKSADNKNRKAVFNPFVAN